MTMSPVDDAIVFTMLNLSAAEMGLRVLICSVYCVLIQAAIATLEKASSLSGGNELRLSNMIDLLLSR